MRRPQYISRLAIYLQSKEPLIYLFIINSDFIEDIEGKELGPFFAGVKYEDRRVKFFYKEKELNKLTAGQLYLVILHEAFHIFKRHLERHKKLTNRFALNISEDAVINYEIEHAKFSYDLQPEKILGMVEVPSNFLYEHKGLKEDAIETNRLYHWLMKQKIKKRHLFYLGAKVKIKSTGEYGKIVNSNSSKKKYEVETGRKQRWHHEDNLIPVVEGGGSGVPVNVDFEVEYRIFRDKHFDNKEPNAIEEKLFTEKIVKQAKKMQANQIAAGIEKGNLLDTVEKLLKPKINWRKELNKRMNIFYSENAFLKSKKLSIVNYPWNAKSRYGILSSYWIKMIKKLQTYIIFAIDTSGSVFCDKYEVETFFTEVDAAAKELEFNRRGQILTIQWDTEIQEGLKVYRIKDWKKYNLKGGGGTTPEVVFDYIEKVFKKINGSFIVNEKGVRFLIRDYKNLPLLVFLTDGYFYNALNERKLKIYKNNKKNVIYFTRKTGSIFPKENYIKYEG